LRIPPLLADFSHARACKPFCEKYLTLPDVYSFNPRAEKTYLKAGFKREGVLKDAVKDGDQYADDILMAILEDEWRELK
jgi:hypothetical protein